MFREMRRKKQMLPLEESVDILKRGSFGTLALLGDGGYPYAVPLSYVYAEDRIYFHGAAMGHKADAVKSCEKASFCVVDKDDVVAEEYTTYFRSVIAFGKIRMINDRAEMRKALSKLALKYAPCDTEENRNAAIEREISGVCIMEMTIEHITGKEAVELTRKRNTKTSDEGMFL